MRNIKKILTSVMLACIVLFSLLQLSSCYTIKSGKMRSVEGTYELSSYSTDKNEIEENGIKLFIVIISDGTGYYAYEDKDTPLYVSELRCRFTADAEKSGYYSYVDLNFTGGNDDWHTFGINSRLRNKNLNSYKPKYQGNIFDGTYGVKYYIDVDFTRVSSKTNLSYVEKIFGKQEVKPYKFKQFEGVYFYSGASSDDTAFDSAAYPSPYVYYYMNVDLYSNKGEVWYMLKSDEIQKNEKLESVRLVEENGEYVLYLGDERATFEANAPYYGDMKIPVKLDFNGTELDGYYKYHLSVGKTVDQLPDDIQLHIYEYERQKNSDSQS